MCMWTGLEEWRLTVYLGLKGSLKKESTKALVWKIRFIMELRENCPGGRREIYWSLNLEGDEWPQKRANISKRG